MSDTGYVAEASGSKVVVKAPHVGLQDALVAMGFEYRNGEPGTYAKPWEAMARKPRCSISCAHTTSVSPQVRGGPQQKFSNTFAMKVCCKERIDESHGAHRVVRSSKNADVTVQLGAFVGTRCHSDKQSRSP